METLTESPPVATLNEGQAEAFEHVKKGGNILITGPAGTGKSFLMKAIREEFPDMAVTGSTGISALNIGGCTLHSWASLGVGDRSGAEIARALNEKKNGIWYSLKRVEKLAIDEISMIPADLLDTLDAVLRGVRKIDRPFGGVQIIALGDFHQLPPVSKPEKPAFFAFESKAWKEAQFKVIVLSKVMRQKDEAFASVLSRVRVGDVSEEVRSVLRTRIQAVDPDPTITPVSLATHNDIADKINKDKLAEINSKEIVWQARDYADNDFLLKQLDRDCIALKSLSLKIGAQVMLLKNLSPEEGLMNGSLGILTDVVEGQFSEETPVVTFDNGVVREIEPASWEIKRNQNVLASRKQIPLRPAWAISIHKSQGLTIPKVRVFLKKCFADGQAYVALSRAKTLEGLFIEDISVAAIRANPAALEFYRRHAS